jgi:hypothetical protein
MTLQQTMPFKPTIQDIQSARVAFEANEPRDLFFRVATGLVDLAIRGVTSLSVAEALAVLLQTWNAAYYRFLAFDSQHYFDIDHLIASYRQVLADFRPRSIETLSKADCSKRG